MTDKKKPPTQNLAPPMTVRPPFMPKVKTEAKEKEAK